VRHTLLSLMYRRFYGCPVRNLEWNIRDAHIVSSVARRKAQSRYRRALFRGGIYSQL
jgi:hypothetical protein